MVVLDFLVVFLITVRLIVGDFLFELVVGFNLLILSTFFLSVCFRIVGRFVSFTVVRLLILERP